MRLSLKDFRTAPATHFVSLGNRCATAYNLRRFYNFHSAFPFDWWITPAAGVVTFLQHPDVENLYNPVQLELANDGKTVHHRNLKFQLHHEFPREGTRVRAGWQNEIELPKKRTTALLTRFLGLNSPGNRIVFVREQTQMSDRIVECLDVLFSLPDYTLAAFPKVAGSHQDASGWRGDPVLWDGVFSALGLSLDRTNHQPFSAGKSVIETDHHPNNSVQD